MSLFTLREMEEEGLPVVFRGPGRGYQWSQTKKEMVDLLTHTFRTYGFSTTRDALGGRDEIDQVQAGSGDSEQKDVKTRRVRSASAPQGGNGVPSLSILHSSQPLK